MKKLNLSNLSVNEAFDKQVDLYVEAMMMVSSKYGSSLTHEEFMDKTEECFCMLLEKSVYGPEMVGAVNISTTI